MCLILFSWKNHKKYKLILAANRDEFYNRPAMEAHFWNENPNLLAGKDLTGGGTWMGISRTGTFAMLTNYRDIPSLKPKAPTRGHLVSDYLMQPENPQGYLEKLLPLDFTYNGYNLIVGNMEELFYHSNFSSGVHRVEEGIHGLSNHLLDSPWPKVNLGKEKLKRIVSKNRFSTTELLDMMYDNTRAGDAFLPDTGVGLEKERMLSPMFIKSPEYGSRCSTVILVDWKNNVTFRERTYKLTDFSFTENKFRFKLK